MTVNSTRYGVISAFAVFAISSGVVAYPEASVIISLAGSVFAGFLCSFAAQFGEDKS